MMQAPRTDTSMQRYAGGASPASVYSQEKLVDVAMQPHAFSRLATGSLKSATSLPFAHTSHLLGGVTRMARQKNSDASSSVGSLASRPQSARGSRHLDDATEYRGAHDAFTARSLGERSFSWTPEHQWDRRPLPAELHASAGSHSKVLDDGGKVNRRTGRMVSGGIRAMADEPVGGTDIGRGDGAPYFSEGHVHGFSGAAGKPAWSNTTRMKAPVRTLDAVSSCGRYRRGLRLFHQHPVAHSTLGLVAFNRSPDQRDAMQERPDLASSAGVPLVLSATPRAKRNAWQSPQAQSTITGIIQGQEGDESCTALSQEPPGARASPGPAGAAGTPSHYRPVRGLSANLEGSGRTGRGPTPTPRACGGPLLQERAGPERRGRRRAAPPSGAGSLSRGSAAGVSAHSLGLQSLKGGGYVHTNVELLSHASA
eukprot:CAMPEP_0175531790 /NCGR_PEP_ID=MMETSP0096-20121207/22343_1 /TAXON_ID=311494 /ORGANISM="Alexandrium monilatum, Strain CCMP3105" /LENGTH=424 /DNA_ID=CAMNT_0016834523 /DNA_START=93 /DNA_END=1364 /DNA_ORIENTATION=+